MSGNYTWLRVLPSVDPDAGDDHELIMEWDADWQDWSVESLGAGIHRLSLYVSKDMLQVARTELEAHA